VAERLGNLDLSQHLIDAAVQQFARLRDESLQLDKKPSIGELLAWIRVLKRAGIASERLAATPLNELPAKGALLKNESDMQRVAEYAH
jgi:hypothetical protein